MIYQKPSPRENLASSADVVEVAYQPSTAGLPVESFTLSSLLQRQTRAHLVAVERIQFDLLIYCRAASARHEVDFEEVALRPHRILHIRPGQVHRWLLDPPYQADLILLRPLDNPRRWKPGPHLIEADGDLRRDLDEVLGLTRRSGRSTPLAQDSLEAIRALLVALLGLNEPDDVPMTHRERIYTDFERLLGRAEPPPRSVHQCARLIGCSARSLTRACHSAVGAAPKHLIDRALALEAQRQLSLAGSTATEVADRLGFAELSHFSRFFTRVTGATPSAFAAATAGTTPSRPLSGR